MIEVDIYFDKHNKRKFIVTEYRFLGILLYSKSVETKEESPRKVGFAS